MTEFQSFGARLLWVARRLKCNPLSAFCHMASESWRAVPYWRTQYVIFSLTQCNFWHTPMLLLQLWLGTGDVTLLLGWATFGLLLNCLTIITQLQQKMTMLCDFPYRIHAITATAASAYVVHQCCTTAWGMAQGVNGAAVGTWHLRGWTWYGTWCSSAPPSHWTEWVNNTHTHTRLTALYPGLPGWAGTRKVKPIWGPIYKISYDLS